MLLGPAYCQDWSLPFNRWRLSQVMSDSKPDGVILGLDTDVPGQGGSGLELCLEVVLNPVAGEVEATVVCRMTNECWDQV